MNNYSLILEKIIEFLKKNTKEAEISQVLDKYTNYYIQVSNQQRKEFDEILSKFLKDIAKEKGIRLDP